MSEINGHDLIDLFEQYAPKQLAVTGDKIGLQIGTLNKKISNVLIALDVVEEVVDEAIAKNAQLIIAHHPLIFRSLQNILTDSSQGRIIEKLIKNNIAVYIAHTNLDVTVGGVNDMLAQSLQLTDCEVLAPTFTNNLKKLAVFVPLSHADQVRTALGECGAGHIGNYSHCSFSMTGTGRFLPGSGTNPFSGKQGELKAAEEVKIETVFPASLQATVIEALLASHPYEEVAYDIYPLDNVGEELGLGRIGNLKKTMSLQQFANYVKECLDIPKVRVVGNLTNKIKKVAILGGDGNKYFTTAKYSGADVYVTGDVYYHTAQDAQMLGLNIVDPGHHIEQIMKQGVATKLKDMCEQNNFKVTVIPSKISTEPFQFV